LSLFEHQVSIFASSRALFDVLSENGEQNEAQKNQTLAKMGSDCECSHFEELKKRKKIQTATKPPAEHFAFIIEASSSRLT
jgi:hypothetical protein